MKRHVDARRTRQRRLPTSMNRWSATVHPERAHPRRLPVRRRRRGQWTKAPVRTAHDPSRSAISRTRAISTAAGPRESPPGMSTSIGGASPGVIVRTRKPSAHRVGPSVSPTVKTDTWSRLRPHAESTSHGPAQSSSQRSRERKSPRSSPAQPSRVKSCRGPSTHSVSLQPRPTSATAAGPLAAHLATLEGARRANAPRAPTTWRRGCELGTNGPTPRPPARRCRLEHLADSGA